MTNLLFVLYMFPGPLWPLIISWLILRKRSRFNMIFLLAGILSIVVFTVTIAIPYYFQGYSDSPITSGEGLGWTRNALVAPFSYLYTFDFHGFLWLLTGLLLVAFGDTSFRKPIDYPIRGCLLSLLSWYLFEFHLFHSTINRVLE
jgi:hypothetical protein